MEKFGLGLALGLVLGVLPGPVRAAAADRQHPVPREHPYLLGSREGLRALARERAADYQRMARVARDPKADANSRIISASLVAAIEGDQALAKTVQQMAMKFVNGPIRAGHVPFANDLALCGLAYDLCYDAWPEADRRKFHEYLNKTVDANVQSEPHVFHNGWYGYKNWGIGVAAYACYHDNERAPTLLRNLEQEYRDRAAPADPHAADPDLGGAAARRGGRPHRDDRLRGHSAQSSAGPGLWLSSTAMSAQVRTMFASIAHSYDRANQVLSLGLHHRWRAAAVRL